MSIEWYRGPIYDWHLDFYLPADSPDAFECFDPERIVDEISNSGANLVVLFALNQYGYAYYPSKIAPPHPMLKGLDYTGELIRAFKKRNIHVLTYVNYMNIDLREKYPDWWQRYSDGSMIIESGWGVPCPNGPIKEYMKGIVQEIAKNYDTEGFFFDMYGFNKGGCYCQNCKDAFKSLYGFNLPDKEDWDNEIWRKFVKFRYLSAYKTMKEIRDVAKEINSNLLWITHTSPLGQWHGGTGFYLSPEIDDILHTEVSPGYGKYRWVTGEMGKLLTATSRGKPCIVNLADLHVYWDKPKGWFYIPNSAIQLKLCTAEIIANGCWPSIYMEPYPNTIHNPYTNEGIKEAFSLARSFEPYLTSSETIKSVSLHFSKYSYDFFEDYIYSFRGMYKALIEAHIPFDIVIDEDIKEGKISDYALLILSNSASTSEEVNKGLIEYVNNGGSILATYATSLYDTQRQRREDFGIKEILGVTYKRELDSAYFIVDHPLNDRLTSSPIIAHKILEVEARNNTKILGKVISTSPTDLFPFTYVSAPLKITENPSITKNGQVIYCSSDIGYSFMKASYIDHKNLIANIISLLVEKKLPIKVKAPSTLDVVLRKQKGRILIHLINLTTNQVTEDAGCSSDIYEIIPLYEIEIELLGGNVKRIYKASDNRDIPCILDGDKVKFKIPNLELYEIIVCELRD